MIIQTHLRNGQEENKILRKTAEMVADIKSADIKALIEKMAEAMFNEPDGIGIAAPQIGESLRIFLVAQDFLGEKPSFKDLQKPGFPGSKKDAREKDYLSFINPVIKKLSQRKEKDIEGCLSVRGLYGTVLRSEKLTIEYFDEAGKKHHRGASGLLARVIQHEIDHLNGVLFIDKAANIKHITHGIQHEK